MDSAMKGLEDLARSSRPHYMPVEENEKRPRKIGHAEFHGKIGLNSGYITITTKKSAVLVPVADVRDGKAYREQAKKLCKGTRSKFHR